MAITITPHGRPGGGRVDVTVEANGRTFSAWAKGDTSWLFQPATRSINFETTRLFTGPKRADGSRPTTEEAHPVYRVGGLSHILLHGPGGSRGCLAINDFDGFRAAVGNRATVRIAGRGRNVGHEQEDDDDRGSRLSRREQDDDRQVPRRSARDRDGDGREDERPARRHSVRDTTARNPFGDFEIPGSNSNIRYDVADNDDAPARRTKKSKPRARDDDDDPKERPNRRTRYPVAEAKDVNGPPRTPARQQVASRDEGIDAWNRGGGSNPFGRG
jgi:hypothetical protein